jgi:hypothetical protein
MAQRADGVMTIQTSSIAPLVSVLLPVHDGEAYLAAAIDSILRQTYDHFELIVIDDGSSDGSARIAQGYDDPRVRVVRNDTNLGLVATLNKGLALARGHLIARMDADDVADPRRLEAQVDRLLASSSIAALGTAIAYIDATGHVSSVPPRQVQGATLLRWRLLRGTCVYHPTLMIERSRAGDDARYSPEFPHAEDYELLLRLSRRHDVDNLPQVLLHQRVHGGSVSSRHRDVQRESAARALLMHVRLRYGFELAPGAAQALLDPRHYVGPACMDADSPIEPVLALERVFLQSEAGITQADRRAVRRDVAFFMWKVAAIALTDWRQGAFPMRRARLLAACAWNLARRPRSALAALAWR